MQVDPDVIGKGHEQLSDCVQKMEKRWQHAAVVSSQKALDCRFIIYGEELEQVEAFWYLSRLISFDDNDARIVSANLRKAHKF